MNESKLYRAFNSGKLDLYLKKISEAEKKQLLDLIKWDIINYKEACKNYPKDRYEECSIPFLKKKEMLKRKLEENLMGE